MASPLVTVNGAGASFAIDTLRGTWRVAPSDASLHVSERVPLQPGPGRQLQLILGGLSSGDGSGGGTTLSGARSNIKRTANKQRPLKSKVIPFTGARLGKGEPGTGIRIPVTSFRV